MSFEEFDQLKKEEKEKSTIAKVWIAVIVLSIAVTFLFTYLFLFKLSETNNFNLPIDPSIFGQYGDVIGGFVGTILAFLSVYLLYKTYQSQKQELKETKNALQDQKNESTIFIMFSTLRDIIKDMEGEVDVDTDLGIKRLNRKGREYLHSVIEHFKRSFAYEELPPLIYNPLTFKLHTYTEKVTDYFTDIGPYKEKIPDERYSIAIPFTRDDIANNYLKSVASYQYNIDHYFRFLKALVEYIDQLKYHPDKERYFSILKAQLSQDELTLIFYHTLSRDESFHSVVDEWTILEHLHHTESLYEDWHHFLYPLTDFYFFTDEEKKEKANFRNRPPEKVKPSR